MVWPCKKKMDKMKKELELKFKGKDNTIQPWIRRHKGEMETFHSLAHTKHKWRRKQMMIMMSHLKETES
jgi:hypothetical protein